MQARSIVLSFVLAASLAAPLGATDRGDNRRGDGGDNRRGDWGQRPDRPNISIEPYIDLSRPQRPNMDTPEFVLAEVQRCATAGILLFVDCLRQNHTAIMIRRLEACVRSETIPDDLHLVAACVPLAPPVAGQPEN